MILNCAIIDDEPLAAELISSYVKKTPFLNLSGTYNSASTAIRDLKERPVELVFLDIQMPELSGVEFARIAKGNTHNLRDGIQPICNRRLQSQCHGLPAETRQL